MNRIANQLLRDLGRRLRIEGMCIAVAAALGLSWAVCGQCQYEIIGVVQGPNCTIGGPQPTFANGMNSKGWVVGSYWDCLDASIHHAFVWKPGEGLTTLPKPPGVASSRANDVNDLGFIVGEHWYPQEGWKAFVFDPNTQEYKHLEALHPIIGTVVTVSSAAAINNSNVVAGSRVVSAPGVSPVVMNAVIWHPYGVDGDGRELAVDLGDMGVGPNSSANAINLNGALVGWTGQGTPGATAYIYESGEVTLIAENYGATSSNLFGINSLGTVGGAGKFFGDPLTKAFLLAGTSLTIIEPLPGYTQSGINALNDYGQAVVRSTPGDAGGLYQHGKQIALEDLLVGAENISVSAPRVVDNEGRLLARGIVSGKTVGLVIAPFNKPTTDLNADCVTDVHDLLILLKKWGPCKVGHCPADLTGDGFVGVADLLKLLANWG